MACVLFHSTYEWQPFFLICFVTYLYKVSSVFKARTKANKQLILINKNNDANTLKVAINFIRCCTSVKKANYDRT